MQMTERGLLALAGHEGVVPAPYRDSTGTWTFGIGHTAAAGPPDPAEMPRGMPADLDAGICEAFRVFRADLATYEAEVRAAVTVPLAPHEFDALVESLIGQRLKRRKTERDDIAANLRLIESEAPAAATLPNFAEAYAAQVRRLGDVLRDPEYIERAQEALRQLIDEVVLLPDATADDGMRINLHGEMARILASCAAASGIEMPNDLFSCPESQLSVVAGARYSLIPATMCG